MSETLPDIKPIEAKGATIYKRIADLSIKTKEDLSLASALLVEVKRVGNTIKDEFAASVESAHRSHKAVLALRDKALSIFEESEKLAKEKIGLYRDKNPDAEAEGVSFVERWTYEVVDEKAVKPNYQAIDHNKIRGVVLALGQEAEKAVGGIRVYKNLTVKVSA